ncbi:MAG: hypothetical protein ACREF7_01230 [Candidatus Saccharimonadales bacterium]
MKNILLIFSAICFLVVFEQLYSDFSTKSSTALITVATVDPNASLSVIRHSREAHIGKGSTKIRLSPDSYTILASRDGMSSSKSISIKAKSEQNIYLNPRSVHSMVFANNTIASQNLQIIHLLPFVGPGLGFKITYSFSGPSNSQMTVVVTAPSAQNQQEALTWLKSVGINPGLYNLQFITAAITL